MSVCVWMLVSSPFCAAWAWYLTPAFDSMDLGHVTPTFRPPPPSTVQPAGGELRASHQCYDSPGWLGSVVVRMSDL